MTLEGLPVLEKKLVELGAVAGSRTMLRVMRRSIRFILNAAKRNLKGVMHSTRRVKFNVREVKTADSKTFKLQAKPAKSFWFAHIFEEGAKPHDIAAKKKKVLSSGSFIYGKRIRHPGIKATHFFKNAFDRNIGTVINDFSSALEKEIDKVAK